MFFGAVVFDSLRNVASDGDICKCKKRKIQ